MNRIVFEYCPILGLKNYVFKKPLKGNSKFNKQKNSKSKWH